MTTEFYRPEAPDGRIVQAHCPPVNSFILFNRNNVIIGAKASRISDNQVSITITFEVPEGQTVELIDHGVEFLLNGKNFSIHNLFVRKWVSPGRTAEFPLELPMVMVGKTEKKFFFEQVTLYGTTEHAYFLFKATFPVENMKTFEIKLPKLLINDDEVILPVIIFKQDSEFYIGSFNC